MISVIIPVYNGAETLRRCLESLHNSTYSSFECIVVDDDSSDDSSEVAESFGVKVLRLDKRWGAAYARNRGADAAEGDILLFIDADVEIYPDCLEKIETSFRENPQISALFGSYDDHPGRPNFLSQYRNLFHHYIHQTSKVDASTFWTACGAIKRNVFFEVGRFDNNCRMMEDIELGYRLKARGHDILLKKDLFVRHWKSYSFVSLLKADLFDRAVPWTALILSHKPLTNDLNLKATHKLSALLLIMSILCLFLASVSTWILLPVPILLAGVLFLNRDVYTFFWKKKGLFFTLKVIPLHLFYYLYSSLGFILGFCKYLRDKRLSSPKASNPAEG